MTAAYDDDTISSRSRKEKNVKNSNVPVDFSNSEKIVAVAATAVDKSLIGEDEDNGASRSENFENAGQSVNGEIIFSEKTEDESVLSGTVNHSITGRCGGTSSLQVVVASSIVNKDDKNCTIIENRGEGGGGGGNDDRASDYSCASLLAKQKNNVEEIILETEKNLSVIELNDSVIVSREEEVEEEEEEEEGDGEGEKMINKAADEDSISIMNDKSCLESTKISFEHRRRSRSSESPYNTATKINNEEKLNTFNLTDENKSRKGGEVFMIYRETDEPTIIVEDVTVSSVNRNPEQKGSVKSISLNENGSVWSNACGENAARLINSIDRKIGQQKIAGRSKPDEVVHTEIRGGDIFEVKNGIKEELSCGEFDTEDYDPECEMSFHEAIRAGDSKSVEMLIARGAVQNIDEPDWNVSGDPPLLVAATNHSLNVLRVLLSNGCDPGVRSPRGETALHRAILNGSPSSVFEMVEELLKYGCPSTVKEAGGGLTALHVQTRQLVHAQSSKSLQHNFDVALKTLELLAKVGPIDAKDHQGRSALHLLASSSTFGNSHRIEIEPMIRTLLDAGADPSLKNDRGETPLHEALERGALNTAFLLIPYTPIGITSRYGETPLHIAARKNQSEVVETLLKRGEDPGFQDAGGNTPLHLASARGFHQTVSLLVTSPLAQLEKTNDEGLTSLQVAAESGFVNAVKILLKAGADPSQTAHYCVTTLHRHPDISVLINHELTRRRQLAA